ncbi:MAG: ASCH domain-containing protein [Patescibacteria group bacterium]
MKTRILRFNAKDRINFDQISSGKKKVETRAATDKYRKIEKGDVLVFVCGKERVEKKIKKVEVYKSLDAMFRKINFKKIMPDQASTSDCKKIYMKYPGYKEKLPKFGVVAFYL